MHAHATIAWDSQTEPTQTALNQRMKTVCELSPHSGMFKNIGATWRCVKGKEGRGPRVELSAGVKCLEPTKCHRWEPVVTANGEEHSLDGDG